MKLVIGLGNPGFRYRNTRHNIGFLVVKEISKRFDIPIKNKKCNGFFARGSVESEKLGLFIPLTFMNLSGEAVREIVKKQGVNPGDILVICDDINLKFGSLRLRRKGSSGGHKGLKSIIESLGTNEFPRLRVGVGKSPNLVRDAVKFVLNPFDSKERSILKDIIRETVECAVTWVKSGADEAMTRFNR